MLQRYFLRQTFWPLMASVGALGLLALLTQSIATLDIIIDQRQSIFAYMEITLLALPQLIALILPLALFVAALYALNRLHGDSELVVTSAAGMSRWQVASPIMKLAMVALMINLAINLWLQPVAYQHMRERLYEIRGDLAATLVRPGEFRQPAEGLTIYAREVEPGGRLVNLIIEDARDEASTVTYMAREGVFTKVDGEPALVMYDGSIQSLEADRSLSYLQFESYPFELSEFLDEPGDLFYKLSDRYLHQLLLPEPNDLRDWRYRPKLYSEANYRLAAPLYSPAFVLIALAAVVGGGFARTGNAGRIAIAAVAALMVRLAGFAAQSASAEEPSLNVTQYLIPLATCFVATIILLSARHERAPRRPNPKRRRGNHAQAAPA